MRQEEPLTQLRRRIAEEIRAAKTKDDRWLLVHLTRKQDDTIISLGSDTVFEGFKGSRELRGPRWRELASALDLTANYSWIVAGEAAAYVLFRQLLAGHAPKAVIMHFDAVHRWAPQCAVTTETVNSVHGFLNPGLPENRGRGAKRPGRVTRDRLTSGGCRLCGSKLELTLHHLIPREMGGATEEENLLSVCRSCHDAIHKGELDVTQLVMEVFVKRTTRLLQTMSCHDRSEGSANDA